MGLIFLIINFETQSTFKYEYYEKTVFNFY